MRTPKQLPVGTPVDTSAPFPDGTVFNDVPSQPGTPVVREIYGDVLVNLYAFMRSVGIIPNGVEDSADNGYQLLSALELLVNIQNDVERILTLNGAVFSLNLDITILPTKYFVFAKAVGGFVNGTEYTLQGTEVAPAYGFTSPTGFNDGDELLIILDQTGARAYSQNVSSAPAAVVPLSIPFGIPVAFNNSSKVWYQTLGTLFSDTPETYDLQSAVRTKSGDGSILVYEILVIGGSVLCLTFSVTNTKYSFYRFAVSNLNAAPTIVTGSTFPTGTDNKPFVYTDGTKLYVSNESGNNVNDYVFDVYTMSLNTSTITPSATISLDSRFQKTTNAVINSAHLYTLIAGTIVQFDLGSGAYKYGNFFPTFLGNLFNYNSGVYFGNDGVAKKLTLPIYS